MTTDFILFSGKKSFLDINAEPIQEKLHQRISEVQRIILEIQCTDRLQQQIEYANTHTLKSFQLRLVMDEKESECK